jgi:hypothetical protein
LFRKGEDKPPDTFPTDKSACRSAVSMTRWQGPSRRCQMRRTHAQANNRSFRSLAFSRNAASIGIGSSQPGHSTSFMRPLLAPERQGSAARRPEPEKM